VFFFHGNERLRAGFKRHKKADSAVHFFIMAGPETRHRHA
jgi:hypothetical protein